MAVLRFVTAESPQFYLGKAAEGYETRIPGRSFGDPMNSRPAASKTDCISVKVSARL
jgi:hypothetical protein